MESHNCIRELRTLMSAAEQKNSDLRKELDEVKYELAEQRRDIGLLKEVIRKHRGGAEFIQGRFDVDRMCELTSTQNNFN